MKQVLISALAFVSLASACSDSSPDTRTQGQTSQTSEDTVIADPGSGDRAYVLESLDDFVGIADQAGAVTITSIDRDPEIVEVHNDELLQNRLVRATVDEGIKGLAAGQEIVFADGMYTRTRSSPQEEYGDEVLLLVTEGVELSIGDSAIVGLRNGEIMSDAVFIIDEGTVQDSSRTGQLFDAVEGRPSSEVVTDMQGIVAERAGE